MPGGWLEFIPSAIGLEEPRGGVVAAGNEGYQTKVGHLVTTLPHCGTELFSIHFEILLFIVGAVFTAPGSRASDRPAGGQ